MNGAARILLLCDDRRTNPNAVLDHIAAFRRFSRHAVHAFNPLGLDRSVALDLAEFDAVVIHYSIVLSDPYHVSADLRGKLRRFAGLKVQLIQDEYRWVDRTAAASREAGIGVLFTVASGAAAAQLYDERLPGVRRVHTLTGYAPEDLAGRPVVPLEERRIDVGYRGRDLPFWMGRLSQEKVRIGEGFLERAPAYGLRTDIAWREPDRIYGARWIDFISSCRATLGTESGASIADFDGSVEQAVRAYLHAHPGASYDEVDAAVLYRYEGNVVVNVVSPRVFEAAALGTALVMFPGEYSGVVSPGRHYIALDKDFGNMADVVEQLRDDRLVSEMTARARQDLIESGRWSHRAFIEQFDRVVSEEVHRAPRRRTLRRYPVARFERSLRVPGLRVRLFRALHAVMSPVLGRDRSTVSTVQYDSQIDKGVMAIRLAIADPGLRPLLRLGGTTRAPLDRLLRELLELAVLKRIVLGRAGSAGDFAVAVEYDAARKTLRFVSRPAAQPAPAAGLDGAFADLGAGGVKSIEWDHRALGGIVQIAHPRLTIGVGTDGLESFAVLAAIGQTHPGALQRGLSPLLHAAERRPTVT